MTGIRHPKKMQGQWRDNRGATEYFTKKLHFPNAQ